MKTIYFIRHAKSSWDDMSLSDVERPLNQRGFRDAPFMAKMLKGKGASIDQFISSPAVRAFTTATYFSEEFGLPTDAIRQEPFIYHSFLQEVLQFVNELEDDLQTVCIFGHNPTFTSIANHFSEEFIANVPTCGIIKVESQAKHWADVSAENAKMTAFYYPKQYFD